MQNVLGLVAFVAYIAAVIALAAGVTWLVVRLTPAKKKPDTPSEAYAPFPKWESGRPDCWDSLPWNRR